MTDFLIIFADMKENGLNELNRASYQTPAIRIAFFVADGIYLQTSNSVGGTVQDVFWGD